MPELRLRLRYEDFPRRALVLTDTPRPGCPHCRGDGRWTEDYGDPWAGDYGGSRDVRCDCWGRFRLTLLPVPRWAVPRNAERTHGTPAPVAGPGDISS